MDRIKEKLSAVGDAIREKTGKTELLSLDEMPIEIAAIETGIDTSDATAVAGDILSGKTAYVNGEEITGTIAIQKTKTINPGSSEQIIQAGVYLEENIIISGDENLTGSNIKKGVRIFGVDGIFDPASSFKLPLLNPNYPQDVSSTIMQGDSAEATFNIVIDEAGIPDSYTYQWYVDGEAVQGANSTSHTVKNLTKTEIKEIYCEVTSAAGTILSRIAYLNVEQYYTPVLNSSYPANASVTVGTAVTCKVEIATAGNPAAYTYQWYKDGSKVSGATSATYKTTDTKGTHTVYCQVTNAAGTVKSRTATITVSARYLIKSSTAQVTIKKSSSAQAYKADNGKFIFYGLQAGYHSMWVNSVNLTGCKTLKVSGTFTDGDNFMLCVWDANTSPSYTNYTAKKDLGESGASLDVSKLSGNYRVGLTSVYTNVQVITNFWLE